MASPPTKRDLISITDVSDDLPALLDRALALKLARAMGDLSRTRPDTQLALIFEKPSTRTRTSFEVAISDLGGRAIYYSAKDMQMGRGETIADTARVLSRYVSAIAYRAFHHEDELALAANATIPVINALDNHEHPCQIVADLLTLKERWPEGFAGKRLAYIGDGNNVLQSLMLGCAVVGLDFAAAIPKQYRPTRAVTEEASRLAARSGAKISFTEKPAEAAVGADALYTDVWVSMGDEAEQEVREIAFQGFQINTELLALAKPTAWVLHDLPAHRGLEITDEVIDGPRSAVWDQAENRLHAQKAILELLLPESSGRGSR